MDFSFGIITDGTCDSRINLIIDSIEKLKIPNYEIIIVGSSKLDRKNTTIIEFDENIKPKWITKKKNIITENSKYENIVYSHDYVSYEKDWYDGFLKYGDAFNACMTKIINYDNSRYRDWLASFRPFNYDQAINSTGIEWSSNHKLIPYDMKHLSKNMYFSGAYWVSKKSIMEEIPLNEDLCWGEGEDIFWSCQYRDKYDFDINPYSTAKLLKVKDPVFTLADKNDIDKFMEIEQ